MILTAGLVLTSCKSNTETDTATDSATATAFSEKQTEQITNNNDADTEVSDEPAQEAIESEESPVFTFDETDEILVQGQEFAESYAKMYWSY